MLQYLPTLVEEIQFIGLQQEDTVIVWLWAAGFGGKHYACSVRP
jgi:hypothetical protein